MSEFKGTQGNWILNEKYQTIEDSEGYGIAQQNGIKNSNSWLEDAKLIACAPEMFKEINETIIDLKILRNQILDASKTNHLFEGMPELIDKWIERKEELIKKATE